MQTKFKPIFDYYTTLMNVSTNYLVMCNVYTDVGGIKKLYHVCPPVRKAKARGLSPRTGGQPMV